MLYTAEKNEAGKQEEAKTSEYKLANGYILTDDEIEQRATEYESGAWYGHLVELTSTGEMSASTKSSLQERCSRSERLFP